MRRCTKTIDVPIPDREDGPIVVSVRCFPDPDFRDYVDTEVVTAIGEDGKAVTLTERERFYASERAVCVYCRDD